MNVDPRIIADLMTEDPDQFNQHKPSNLLHKPNNRLHKLVAPTNAQHSWYS